MKGKKYFCSPGIENIIETAGCLRGLFMLKSISAVKIYFANFLFFIFFKKYGIEISHHKERIILSRQELACGLV